MPSKRWRGSDFQQRAQDAQESIEALHSYITRMSKSDYLRDRKTQSAVERELLTVAEACGKMLDMDETIETRFPSVPWRSVRGLGNVIRHEYGRVDPNIVWDTITGDDLQRLSDALKALV